MTAFTVLIPTHDHADTLSYAVKSVQWQTCGDFELFIVGDGVPDRTREIVAAFAAEDPRIRFFDFPKGERHGERHRHLALAEAVGRFVCYQADDDLWFPEHLATMAALLEDHDLAHCMQVELEPDGRAFSWMFDATVPRALHRMREAKGGFGFNSGGHRLDAYRRLPVGWHPAPAGFPTDYHFWLQFLQQPWCRYVSYKWPEAIHLSSVARKGWEPARRVEELATWWERIQSASHREEMVRKCLLPLHDQLVQDIFQSSSDVELVREIRRLTEAVTAPAQSASGLAPYVLGQELLFRVGGNAAQHVLSGFSLAEHWGRWTVGPLASVVLPLAEPVTSDLIVDVEMQPFLHGALRPVCTFSVALNGNTVLRVDATNPAANRYTARVPHAICAGAPALVLGIAAASPTRPVDLGMSNDDRPLGVGLVSLRISVPAPAG